MKPLQDLLVLEFAQYMAAPTAGLRLADLGARVIKIERPGAGEGGRQIAVKNLYVDGDSLIFHTINRNKQSYAADLKNPVDRKRLEAMIAGADVMTHNFRPGVMEKLGLDHASIRQINPAIIYGEVTGFGPDGPWKNRPGQDLLVQSVSGLTWLSGNRDDPPTPFGLAVADILCGAHFAQGLLAALFRRQRTGAGAHVAVSLLESILDVQFEVLTTYLNDGGRKPDRSGKFNAHAYLSAPYGIYPTKDGYLALAMGDVSKLGGLIGSTKLAALVDSRKWFAQRDEIQREIAARLANRTTAEWLASLEPAGVWCSDVFDYRRLLAHEAYQSLEMEQTVRRPTGATLRTLRCPIRIEGETLRSDVAAPQVGQHNAELDAQLTAPPAQKPVANTSSARPLEGITVIDLSQFLSGPCAALRLADLGARVIKIERPEIGDICRELYVSNVMIDGESTVFHAINRNKESFAADLKDHAELARVRKLIAKADVVMHNFRPGVAARLGLDFESIRKSNFDIVYGELSGYGDSGPWRNKPGQDLLVQSLSGLTWLTGTSNAGPVPMGLSIIDQLAGMHLAQGILACLIRREKTGQGGLVQVSMLESALDFQFEAITVYLQDGGQPVVRSARNGAHAYLGAPYGIYETSDGFIAIAMARIGQLGELLGCPALTGFVDPQQWFPRRDEIKAILADHLRTGTAAQWLAQLEPADVWCAEVLDWKRLLDHEGFAILGMTQEVIRGTGTRYQTTRSPIRLDGQRLYASRGSPDLGEHTQAISQEFSL